MNALAMAISPAQAQAAAAADARQFSGKQASGGGFAETLIHVMGGAESAKGVQHSVPLQGWFGLAGLLNWNGGAEEDLSSEALLKLIGSLAEKLGLLDDNGQIPSDLQQQLAALLMQVQELLRFAENGGIAPAETQQALHPVLAQNAPAANEGSAQPQEVAQALRKLADHIAQGLLTKEQAASLAEPVRQVMRALKSYAEIQQLPTLPLVVKAVSQVSGPVPEGNRVMMTQAPQGGQSEVQTGMRWQVISRPAAAEQGWAFGKAQAALTAETPFQSAVVTAQATAEAESAVPSNPVPVWTLLKDSQQAVPPAGAQNAQEQLPQSVPIRQFVQEMGNYLVKQFVLTQGNGVSEAKISLHPEHLGQLDIKIVIQNGVLTAKFVAETGAARELLEAQMAQLRSALQGQGLQVERMEVIQQPSQSYASQTGSHHSQHGTGHSHHGGGAKKGNRGGYEENASFETELERTAYLRDFGFGGRLNMTA